MKTLLNAFAALGLLVTSATAAVVATPDTAAAQSRDWRDGRGYDRRDDRRWRDDRRHDRRWRDDRRGRDWRDDRRGRDWRGDRGRHRGPVVRERIIDPRSREARAMGVEYRGGCRYVIRNGRRVCG
ncbi:hypothetical protein [Sphingomonas sp. VNH70]|uniref:hypothetical protein n=1 Tax=Sphingomonas silueang TaxID=3156617 RepID=UPI0032B350A0